MNKKKKPPGLADKAFSHQPFAALNKLVGTPDKLVGTPAIVVPPPVAPTVEADTPSAPMWGVKIVVRQETKGRGGKTITRVSGLPTVQLPSLLTRLKKSLGCGALIENGDLILLGSVAGRAAAWLEKEGASHVIRGN